MKKDFDGLLSLFVIFFLFFSIQGAYLLGEAFANLSLVLQDIAICELGLAYFCVIMCSQIVLTKEEVKSEGEILNVRRK